MPQRNHSYSPEAQAILGKMPSWIVRWGVTVIAAIFVGILVGCYFIKYPDLVEAPVTITTQNPPSDLAARYAGLLDTVCVANGQQVRQGQLLMLLSTSTDYGDVTAVEQHLGASQSAAFSQMAAAEWLDRKYTLGELQATFAQFQQKCMDLRHYLSTDNIARKKQLLAEQIAKRGYYYELVKNQLELGN